MKLSDRLKEIPRDQIVTELNAMLKTPHGVSVSVEWSGRRMVQIENYEDDVEINEIAKKYLKSELFDPSTKNTTLQVTLRERIACYELWGRINQLYVDSHNELLKTSIKKYVVAERYSGRCEICCDDKRETNAMAIIREFHFNHEVKKISQNHYLKPCLFGFTQDIFEKLWGKETKPIEKHKHIVDTQSTNRTTVVQLWLADLGMVQKVVKKSERIFNEMVALESASVRKEATPPDDL